MKEKKIDILPRELGLSVFAPDKLYITGSSRLLAFEVYEFSS